MLVLSRKVGERIVVPHCELALTVIAVDGDIVRLGISAPTEVTVYREEVWQQNCQQTHGLPSKRSWELDGGNFLVKQHDLKRP